MAEPTMIKVHSSNIDSVGFDEDSEELHVIFKNGGHYVYEKVPPSIHSSMIAADSVGGFLFNNIKNNFKFRKLK